MTKPALPKIDPFLLWLVGTVIAASIIPARGAGATVFGILADIAITLLFFFHGAKLSREAVLAGIGNWRLHLLVLLSTYALFPLLGLIVARFSGGLLDPLLANGVLFLTLLPSTVQSSIAFTAMAGGNVAAAVCSASLSNLIGIIVTPLLVTFTMDGSGAMGASGHGSAAGLDSVRSIATQLLLPFLVGHFLRPVIGRWIDQHKAILQPIDRSSILLVVYSAFSAAVVNGIWHKVGLYDLAVLLAASALILALVMGANALAARLARLPREDTIVLLFCGSKKSLVSGVPMAGALFAPAQVGVVVLPLMIFHQLQLFLCAWLAARFRREMTVAPAVPRPVQGKAAMLDRAGEIGLPIPEACQPGVVANLELLGRHAETLLREDRA